MPISHHDSSPNTRPSAPGNVARVAIAGTGLVGATTAYALLISGSVADLSVSSLPE